MTENQIGDIIVELATRIHRKTGPGLLESIYEVILMHELRQLKLDVKQQIRIPIVYDRLRFTEGFRADLVVENKVIIELKCVEAINNAHKKQLLTYLRLTGLQLGYLLNFNLPLMKDGIYRTVNNLQE